MASTRLRRWVRNAAVALVVAAFVLVFGQPRGYSGTGAVAEVNGELIRRDVFEFFRDLNTTRSRDFLPPDMDPEDARNLLDGQTLNSLIHRCILTQEAEALGLRVSDDELAQALAMNPSFQQNGRFDPFLFERAWRRAGLESERVYTKEHRRDLLIRKFQRLISSPVRVSDAQVREAIQREHLRIRLRYAVARAQDLRDRVEIKVEDARRFAEAEPDRLLTAYQARISEFRQPEQIQVRHILFTGEDAPAQAEAARERLRAGEDFEALARELSQDEATRGEGGDLGFFPHGRMLAAFEEAAFALQAGAVSEPVETERGIHLIRLEERRAALERTLDEVSEELARGLLREDRARDSARRAAEEMLEQLQAGANFEKAARELGLTSEETVSFGPRDLSIPGIGRVPGLKESALSLRPEQPHAARVFSDGDVFYVISLLERDELDADALAAEMDVMRNRLEKEARARVVGNWSDSRRIRLQQTGKLVYFPLYPES
jgi:peptidyl-prolyl cis-trans isomerase D